MASSSPDSDTDTPPSLSLTLSVSLLPLASSLSHTYALTLPHRHKNTSPHMGTHTHKHTNTHTHTHTHRCREPLTSAKSFMVVLAAFMLAVKWQALVSPLGHVSRALLPILHSNHFFNYLLFLFPSSLNDVYDHVLTGPGQSGYQIEATVTLRDFDK